MTQFRLAHSGNTVVLDREIGRGGEGAVYSLRNSPDRVAKLYRDLPNSTKVKKLYAMVGGASSDLLRIAAWPIDLLSNEQGRVCGFVMPWITARRDIHELYSPKSRAEAFPTTDFRFLVRVGANIARAFAVIHAHGQVIGDVNHGNLLVGPDGTVMLIDCDSFQVGAGANAFACDVGVPLFTPPELQRRGLRGLIRSANHDLFGLAVLLFHLLYMGRHPFAGRFLGRGDMPIETAIAEYRFAYGPDRMANQVDQPPGTIPLEAMGSAVAALFMKAFGRAGSNGSRPVAEMWVHALVELESLLRGCATANWHHYPRALTACPWCIIEKQTGARLFGQAVIAAQVAGTADVASLWQAIVAVQGPGPDPPLPSERAWFPAYVTNISIRRVRQVIRKTIAIALIFGGLTACNTIQTGEKVFWTLGAYVLAYLVWPHIPSEKRAQCELTHRTAKSNWENAVARWRKEASDIVFRSKIAELERVKGQFMELPRKRQQGLTNLEVGKRQRQLERYLDRFRIDVADIPGIGPSRVSMLASYGIETAADIKHQSVRRIPGFGDTLTARLISWRNGHEQNFHFNPGEPVNRQDVDDLDRELGVERASLISVLRQGPEHLRRLSVEIAAARERVRPVLENSWHELQLAEAAVKDL